MDDYFDLDGSFSNWDSGVDWDSVPNIDISGVGSNAGDFDFSTILGDQPGDFDIGGNYGNPLADGLKDLVDNLLAQNVLNDPFGSYDSPEDFSFTGSYGDPLVPGLKDLVDNLLAQNVLNDPFSTYDSPEDFPTEGSYGDPLAPGVKEAVDELLEYNAAYEGSNTGPNRPSSGGGGGGGGDNTNSIKKILDAIKNNPALAAGLLGVLAGLMNKKSSGTSARGYQGGFQPSSASRQALSPAGAPGSGGGRRFMTDVAYAADGGLMSVMPGQPNQSVMFMKKGGATDEDYVKMGKGMRVGDLRKAEVLFSTGASPKEALDYYQAVPDNMAKGGISSLGSYSDGGRMLKGPGDGMSDSIPASIGGKRPARLADGEFVVPADVVSHLGNGSTDAGADVLYSMMDKVRKARTGSKKQGKQIDPKKFTPK